jgi:hypothetical protein
VVFAVLVETGLNQELVGKRLMSATFVTDFGTAAMLSILFIKPNVWIIPFIAASVVLILGLPRIAPWSSRVTGTESSSRRSSSSSRRCCCSCGSATVRTHTPSFPPSSSALRSPTTTPSTDRTQFSLLITVVVLSAIVPTAIAQRFFQPHPELGRIRRQPTEEFWPESEVA